MSKRTIEDVERELYMAQFRVKKCQYNDHLYDMEKWEYEVEILKDELKNMKMEQTPVEWFFKQLTEVDYGCINKTFLQNNNSLAGHKLSELLEQAKEMEKERLESLKDFDNWKEWKNS